jgi:hypothetical protein
MDLATRIVRPFAGRDRAFDIAPLGAIEALERACGCGMGEILGRLQGRLDPFTGDAMPLFRHSDIRETIRLALLWGGTPDAEATSLVKEAIDGRPIIEHLRLASEILAAYAYGVDAALKKSRGPGGKRKAKRPGPETSPASSPPAS